ncbi:hypothetical protein [Haloglomus litoreum]|uniref:hypothetical protein n=1 Tax=Haloglomus litoreum TaxID=3034026 RepID=UPI0023E8DBA2|nr:hypothetical protein [Haloglomus sp. DT116]
MYHRRAVLALLGGAALAGCGFRSRERTPTGTAALGTVAGPTTPPRTTHLTPSGNRVAAGTGGMPGTEPLDVRLDLGGQPRWVVAVPARDGAGSYWVTVEDEGAAVAHRVDGTGAARTAVRADLSPGQPPTLGADADGPVVPPVPPGTSGVSHPLRLPDGPRTFVADDGALVIVGPDRTHRLDVAAPPDAYPVLAPGGSGTDPRVVVLSDATDRYGHGALGDRIEAGGFSVVDPAAAAVVERVSVPGTAVIEGQAPIVADLSADGRPEVVVTEADAAAGARVAVYSLAGDRVAAGPAVGSGFRWRHQLAVAPFPPDGRPEVAVVRTPHIGGTAEFYRLDGARLRIAATLDGVSSHAIGSRVLDGAVAADADGDGRFELIVPDDARERLVGIRRTADGAEAAWSVPVGGRVASNLHAVTVGDHLVLGVARSDGVLRLWR